MLTRKYVGCSLDCSSQKAGTRGKLVTIKWSSPLVRLLSFWGYSSFVKENVILANAPNSAGCVAFDSRSKGHPGPAGDRFREDVWEHPALTNTTISSEFYHWCSAEEAWHFLSAPSAVPTISSLKLRRMREGKGHNIMVRELRGIFSRNYFCNSRISLFI